MANKKSARRTLLIAGVCGILIVALLVAVIVIVVNKKGDDGHTEQPKCPVPANLNVLEYLGKTDGLDLQWYTGVVTVKGDIANIVQGSYNVLSLDISETPTGVIILKGTSITLSEAMALTKDTKLILKLNLDTILTTTEKVGSIVQELKRRDGTNPVILTLPAIARDFVWERFLESAATIETSDNIIIAFDLKSLCCGIKIGRGIVQYIGDLVQSVTQSVLVEIDGRSLPDSWQNLKWLLDVDPGMTLIITLIPGLEADSNSTVFDMLTVRNDLAADRVLYNLGEQRQSFIHLASSAGSPLIYFNIDNRDAGKIIWSHNTDTWEQLNRATQGDVMMIEGDIRLFGEGTSNKTNVPIMAHDQGDYNNLTFEQWLDAIIQVDKGMKFDFKSIEAVKPALEIASRKRHLIRGPVWLNADILQGPGAGPPRIPKNQFLKDINVFPEATLSLGWTTISKGENYNLKFTMQMVRDMHEICKTLYQPVTFPVRAEQFKDSLNEFDWLLSQSRGYTLTVWTAPVDNVTKADMDFVKRQFERSRVYFDLPAELRPSF